MKFVLVHGGWQGGWAWDGVATVLTSRGHQVLAPTLRGLEPGDVDRAGLTFTDLANGLLEDILMQDLEGFVLVGHSGGGPVVQFVADRLGHRVLRTVFMSAWVLEDGESINDVRPPDSVAASRALAIRSHDNTVSMDPQQWLSAFMQDATPEQVEKFTPRLVPTTFGWFDQRIEIPRFFALRLPVSYLFLRHDKAVPKETFQRMAARLHNPRIADCDGSHQAMLTRPEAVAEGLLSIS